MHLHRSGSGARRDDRRGGGGALKLLFWQGATLLNPHFAVGTKDQEGSRIFYEPLAGWDGEGNLVPVLAAELPTTANGGLSADGKVVTWKLKRGVKWHDGKPFTSKDVVCTFDLLTGKAENKLRANPRLPWYSNVDKVTTNGDYEATFHLTQRHPSLLAMLADSYVDRGADGRYRSNIMEAFPAIGCIDHPTVERSITLATQLVQCRLQRNGGAVRSVTGQRFQRIGNA